MNSSTTSSSKPINLVTVLLDPGLEHLDFHFRHVHFLVHHFGREHVSFFHFLHSFFVAVGDAAATTGVLSPVEPADALHGCCFLLRLRLN